MEFREDDIEILKKETGLNYERAISLLKESKGDVVSAILKFTGEEECVEEINIVAKKPLSETEKKISELRNILDKKDEILDDMLKKQKK